MDIITIEINKRIVTYSVLKNIDFILNCCETCPNCIFVDKLLNHISCKCKHSPIFYPRCSNRFPRKDSW